MDFTLRCLKPDDLSEADRLRTELGWNQTISDWQRLLALAPEGCFAAERKGQLVGTCTSLSFGGGLAWIGMMIVHPSHRGQGLGAALLRYCIDYLRQKRVRCIKLDATPMGKPVYMHLGFLPEWTLTRWEHHGSVSDGGPSSNNVQTLADRHWPGVLALDSLFSGVVRDSLLSAIAAVSCKAIVYEEDGSILGFGMLRSGARADYLGPVAAHPEIGEKLVRSLLAGHDDRPIFWDVPDPNELAARLASQLGFTPARSLTRMFLGHDLVPTDSQGCWGSSDPATG